jgi:Uma2 family endonuclease
VDEVSFMATRTDAPGSLEAGDCMSRAEFHRRYLARPDIKKAELIDGVVYMPSPTRSRQHGRPHGLVVGWLTVYASQASDIELDDNSTVYLDGRVEVQPDAALWRPSSGRVRETEDGYLEGAPQLIVEVAASSVSYDLHQKKEAYRRNGVGEYVVWRVEDRAIDWFRLQDGAYVPIAPDADGIVESEQFPGLRLHIPSMLAGDRASVLAWVRGSAS